MKLLKVSLIFFALVSSREGIAQTNFLKGYYITTNKDTIHGYIENRFDKRNYSFFSFKTDLTKNEIWLYPRNIIEYSVGGQHFETNIFIEKNKSETEAFFKIIVKGKLSLLQYADRYFAKDSDNNLFEITKKRSEVVEGKIKEDYSGMGMLNYLMYDCSAISSSYLKSEFKSQPNYKKIFLKYNDCIISLVNVYEKTKRKPHIVLGVLVSPGINGLKLSGTMSNANMNIQPMVGVGGYASIFIPRINEDISIVIEGTYSQYKAYSYFTNENTNNDLFLNYSKLKIPVIFRYAPQKVFLDFGLLNHFVFNQDFEWRVETVQQNAVSTIDGEVVPFNTYAAGFILGVGINFNIGNQNFLSSFRYSQCLQRNQDYTPFFQYLEVNIALQLTK